MAILSNNTGVGVGFSDPRYWNNTSSHDRYYEEMRRQQYMAMQQQQMAYDPYRQLHAGGVTDQQIQEGKKPAPMPTLEPDYISNKKLLLLEK